MPQTTYSNDYGLAIAGMIADSAGPQHVESPINGEGAVLAPGTIVTIKSDGTVELPKATSSTLNPIYGVVLYDESMPPGGWPAGGPVAVMRKGKVWCSYDGTAPGNMTVPNISHASDNTGSKQFARGYLTASATSTTAGVEITAPGGGIVARADQGVDTTNKLVIAELNFPA